MAVVRAVLGPTNTGKTHFAIERMLAHRTGVIGLPLRLLAREVYDRIVALRGPSVVGLVTGEERIVPARCAYWVCTVEAMPTDIGADFLAIDEIQLAADPERGHVFTDRLLNARGHHETLFLGAATMKGRIASLVQGAEFIERPRFSTLSYTGPKKISRMPERSAIVAFSVDSVYAIAELLRRQKGGCAVVLGALSPRTRNAQVDLYQNGDVDHLVATDAIGMGLNLDIRHIAFAGTAKFDGRGHRALMPNELAQIAGRAGRHTNDGTFGVTGEAKPLDDEVVGAIEGHRFTPIRKLVWRNSRLRFGTLSALIAALEEPSGHDELVKGREADDLTTLKALARMPDVLDRARAAPDVRLLWDTCQIPDFRNVAPQEHASLVARLFEFLHETGEVPADWLATQVQRIDRTEGDIDALSKRLAFIRTWTYVAQRTGWVADGDRWRGETRAVEDRLSDALHARLTQRFVDRRTSVLMRRLKEKESLVAEVSDTGEVTVEGQFVGRLAGFRFHMDQAASPEEAKTLRAAALQAIAPRFALQADRFYNAPDTEIDVTEQGGLMWGEHAVGKLAKGDTPLTPTVQPFVDDEAGAEVAEKVQRRLGHWIQRQLDARFEPLRGMEKDEGVTGLARGIAFQLVEALGVIPRSEIANDIKQLEQEGRALLRKHGVRFGQYTVFLPLLLKPAPTRFRLILWSLWEGFEEFPTPPPPGVVTTTPIEGAPRGYYPKAGYRLSGQRAIRIDMLERLADKIRLEDTRNGFEASPDMLSITGLTLEQFADLMQGLGYRADRGERPRARPAPKPAEPKKSEPKPAGSKPAGSKSSAQAPAPAKRSDPATAPAEPSHASANGRDTAPPPRHEAGPTDTLEELAALAGIALPGTAPAPVPEPVPAEVSAPPAESASSAEGSAPEPETAAPPAPDAAPARTDGAADAPASDAEDAAAPAPDGAGEAPADARAPEDAVADAPAAAEAPAPKDAAADDTSAPEDAAAEAGDPPGDDGPTEMEVFYTFVWAPRRQGNRPPRGDRPQRGPRGDGPREPRGDRPPRQEGDRPPRQDRPARQDGDRPERKDRPPRRPREDAPAAMEADGGPRQNPGAHGKGKKRRPKDDQPRQPGGGKPPRRDDNKPIDPDNPFAALAALKNKV